MVRRSPARILACCLVLAATLPGALAGCHRNAVRPATRSAQQPPVPVTTVVAQEGPVARHATEDGSVIARSEVQILPRTTGRIAAMDVAEGDTVHAGQVIAQLEVPELTYQLEQQQSSLLSATANLAEATDNAQRMQELADQGVVSQQQLVQAQTQAEVARAQVQQTRAAIAQMEAQVANGTITSPIDGVVLTRSQNMGDMASPGTPLYTIAQQGGLQIRLAIPEADLPLAQVGEEIPISAVAVPGATFSARIAEVAPLVDPKTRLVTVKADLPPDTPVRIGMDVSAVLHGSSHQALVVPAEAIVVVGAEQIVYVVRDGHAWRTPIQTGLRSDGEVEVTSGLAAGNTVVVKGSSFLSDGIPVTVTGARS